MSQNLGYNILPTTKTDHFRQRAQEFLNKYDVKIDKAIDIFKQIKDNYINSPEAQEADKFIKQAELLKETK